MSHGMSHEIKLWTMGEHPRGVAKVGRMLDSVDTAVWEFWTNETVVLRGFGFRLTHGPVDETWYQLTLQQRILLSSSGHWAHDLRELVAPVRIAAREVMQISLVSGISRPHSAHVTFALDLCDTRGRLIREGTGVAPEVPPG